MNEHLARRKALRRKIRKCECGLNEISSRCYVSTPNKTSRHLLDLLKDWSDLKVVPVEAVEKLLTTMEMDDALKTLNVLRRIPAEILRKCAKVSIIQQFFMACLIFFKF